MESLKKAFGSVSKQPFHFVWGSLLYLVMLILLLFAGLGIFLLYFMFLSILEVELDFTSIPTIGVVSLISVFLIILFNGINAALAMTYNEALSGRRMNLTRFYSYSLDKAAHALEIVIIRDVIWLLLVGPFIALYFYALYEYQYLDVLIAVYGVFVTFVLHMLFTPAQLLCGAFDAGVFGSLRKSFEFLKKKHVYFIGLYILFAIVWLFNFLPFIQIATVFFLYPIAYSAMIIMIKDTVKIGDEDK